MADRINLKMNSSFNYKNKLIKKIPVFQLDPNQEHYKFFYEKKLIRETIVIR